METKLVKILHTFSRRPHGSTFLLFECSHWLEFMSSRAPFVDDLIACPECNLPKLAAAVREAHDANTPPAGLFKKGEYFG